MIILIQKSTEISVFGAGRVNSNDLWDLIRSGSVWKIIPQGAKLFANNEATANSLTRELFQGQKSFYGASVEAVAMVTVVCNFVGFIC